MLTLQTDIVRKGKMRQFVSLPFADEYKDTFLEKRKEEWREEGWAEVEGEPMRMTNGNDSLEFTLWPTVEIK